MQAQPEKTLLAERLWIPADTQAILWDMDGVLIDSLGVYLIICNQFLKQHFGTHVTVTKAFIRSIAAYDPVKFLGAILAFVEETCLVPEATKSLDKMLETFRQARHDYVIELNPGISDILKAARCQSLKMAVVSNNPTADVKSILTRSGIIDYFESVVGNDIQKVAKKPAPDTYLLAAQLLEVNPEQCVVIEDTLIGIEAGYHANCYTIGVATGGADFETLAQSQWAHKVYASFAHTLSKKNGVIARFRRTLCEKTNCVIAQKLWEMIAGQRNWMGTALSYLSLIQQIIIAIHKP